MQGFQLFFPLTRLKKKNARNLQKKRNQAPTVPSKILLCCCMLQAASGGTQILLLPFNKPTRRETRVNQLGRQSANQSIIQTSSQAGRQAGRQADRNIRFGLFWWQPTSKTDGEQHAYRVKQWLSGTTLDQQST